MLFKTKLGTVHIVNLIFAMLQKIWSCPIAYYKERMLESSIEGAYLSESSSQNLVICTVENANSEEAS